jgi:hypothetical protein
LPEDLSALLEESGIDLFEIIREEIAKVKEDLSEIAQSAINDLE